MTIKAFNRWSVDGIQIDDPGLKGYICLDVKIVPHTGARYANNRFHKSNVFVVERLINRLMSCGHRGKKHLITTYSVTGKGITAYGIIEKVMEQLEKRTGNNPIAVLVKAIENAAPREEIIAIEYGGARYPTAVEMAPQRRVDYVLRFMTQGAYQKSFNSKRSIIDTLTAEILNAFNLSNQSAALAKKLELERQADSSR